MYLSHSNFHAMCLALIQLIVINVVGGEYSALNNNATNDASQRESGRSKRSLASMPYTIYIRIEYAPEQFMDLNWVKQDQYLANEHLPVFMSSGLPNLNAMENVGDFVVYYDLNKCSSVVYFEELDALFGYIGLNYFITYLPYKFNPITGSYPEVVREPYVMKRSNAPIHISFPLPDVGIQRNVLPPSNDGPVGGIKRPLDSDQGSTSKHQRTNRDLHEKNYMAKTYANASEIGNIRKRRGNPSAYEYYLETLVFVSRGIADIFKTSPDANNYVEWIVRYCIIYFNAIDMIFQKIRARESTLRINIAKIVIEDDLEPFPFMSDDDVKFTETAMKLRQDLRSHRHIYTPDSFDHVFTITNLPIEHDSVIVPAMSDYYSNLYQKRREGQFYNAVPITVVDYKSDYKVAAHEIARTLNIETDSSLVGRLGYLLESSSTIQSDTSEPDGSFKWSVGSENQYNEFFRANRNRCFLLNQPRSLRPPGPSIFLSPHKQCICFGYDSYLTFANNVSKGYITKQKCDRPLECKKLHDGSSYHEYTLKPFDGTVCGNRRKVCWDGQCRSFESESCMKN